MAPDNAEKKALRRYREIGLHERYNLAYDNLGVKKLINCVAIGSVDAEPSRAQGREGVIAKLHATLHARIAALLEAAPLLSCHIDDKQSFHPRFAQRQGACSADDVLGHVEPLEDTAAFEPVTLGSNAERWAAEHIVIDKAPLWRVQLLSSQSGPKYAIVLHVHHAIADGRALMGIMRVLLMPHESPMPSALSLAGTFASEAKLTGQDPLPPPSEAINVHHRTSVFFFLKAVLKELLTRVLPHWSRRFLGMGVVSWPASSTLLKPAHEGEKACLYVQLDDNDALFPQSNTEPLVDRLKLITRSYGLTGINTLIHTSLLVGLFALQDRARQSTFAGGSAAAEKYRDSTFFATDTPISIRDERCGTVSGNFVVQSSWSTDLCGESRLVKLTRDYSEKTSSPTHRKEAGRTFSLMPYALGHWRDRFHSPTDIAPTPWEPFFAAQEAKGTPYRKSFELTNVGAMGGSGVLPSIERVFWLQPAEAVSHAININVMGWRREASSAAGASKTNSGGGQITATLKFHRNVFCREEDEQVFEQTFRATMLRFAAGRVSDEETVSEAVLRASEVCSHLKRMQKSSSRWAGVAVT